MYRAHTRCADVASHPVQMDRPESTTNLDVEGFSRAVKASRERARALKHRAYSEDPTEALAHMQTVVEELSVADEELRAQTDALEEARAEVEAERRRYAELFDSAPDPFLVTDLAGIISRANRAATAFFGVPSQYVTGKPLAAFVALPDRKEFRTMLDHATEDDLRTTWDVEFVGRDSKAATFEVHVATSQGGSEAVELRWLLRDVTRRRRAEDRIHEMMAELEEQVAARTLLLEDALSSERAARARADMAGRATLDFITRLSHELRTPLQAAVGYVDIVNAQIHVPVNEAQREALRRVAHAHRHMLALLESLLEIGRVRAGQVALHLADVPVGDVLSTVHAMVTPQLVEHELTFAVMCPDGADIHVRADRTKLEQIILNLVSNAIRYTPRGGSVTVRWCTRESMVLLAVQDSGRGIPGDQLEAIFEPFVRLAAKTSAKAEGTGLGLAISRELACIMGGDLVPTSELGKGSTFTLTLPLATRTTAAEHDR